MTLNDVIAFVDLAEAATISVVIDGGWGVDALLGRQTRPHRDLDIAVEHRHVPALRSLLAERGFVELAGPDLKPWNFVMGDPAGHLIDVHSYTFDENGQLVYGIAYPLESLTGTGTLGARSVRCITPEHAVRFHTGYDVDADDFADVSALCEKFSIELPADYSPFTSTRS